MPPPLLPFQLLPVVDEVWEVVVVVPFPPLRAARSAYSVACRAQCAHYEQDLTASEERAVEDEFLGLPIEDKCASPGGIAAPSLADSAAGKPA